MLLLTVKIGAACKVRTSYHFLHTWSQERGQNLRMLITFFRSEKTHRISLRFKLHTLANVRFSPPPMSFIRVRGFLLSSRAVHARSLLGYTRHFFKHTHCRNSDAPSLFFSPKPPSFALLRIPTCVLIWGPKCLFFLGSPRRFKAA